jgi:hypothetical protein
MESQYNVIWCAVHPKVALLKICTAELKSVAIVRTKKGREKHDEHDKQYMHKRIIEKCLRNHCYRGKAVSITYSECVSAALSIKHASARAVLYCHLWSVWLCHTFSHYLLNDTIFWEELLNIKYVSFFSTTFVWNISYSKKNRARYYHNCTHVLM